MNEVREFFKAFSADPRGKELLKAAKEPKTAEEAADMYVGIAKELGVSVSREEMMEFVQAREKDQQAETARAQSAVKTAVEEEELDRVAGGLGDNLICMDTFSPHEWCWANDSCTYLINIYTNDVKADPKPVPEGTRYATVGDDYVFYSDTCGTVLTQYGTPV